MKRMTSTAIVPKANNLVERIPGDKEMRIINVDEAQKILGDSAIVIDGFSVSFFLYLLRGERKEEGEGRKVQAHSLSRSLPRSLLDSLRPFPFPSSLACYAL